MRWSPRRRVLCGIVNRTPSAGEKRVRMICECISRGVEWSLVSRSRSPARAPALHTAGVDAATVDADGDAEDVVWTSGLRSGKIAVSAPVVGRTRKSVGSLAGVVALPIRRSS